MLKKALCTVVALGTITTVAYAYSYDTNLPLNGNSIADVKLQENTLFSAYMFAHRAATPDCKAFSISDTEVSLEKIDNKWQEIWTIKACSKNVKVPINFELKEEGATYAIDPINVKVSEEQL